MQRRMPLQTAAPAVRGTASAPTLIWIQRERDNCSAFGQLQGFPALSSVRILGTKISTTNESTCTDKNVHSVVQILALTFSEPTFHMNPCICFKRVKGEKMIGKKTNPYFFHVFFIRRRPDWVFSWRIGPRIGAAKKIKSRSWFIRRSGFSTKLCVPNVPVRMSSGTCFKLCFVGLVTRKLSAMVVTQNTALMPKCFDPCLCIFSSGCVAKHVFLLFDAPFSCFLMKTIVSSTAGPLIWNKLLKLMSHPLHVRQRIDDQPCLPNAHAISCPI